MSIQKLLLGFCICFCLSSCEAIYALTVGAACAFRGELKISPEEEDLPDGRLGQPYRVKIEVTKNVTPVFSIASIYDELPPGLALVYEDESTEAILQGTPLTLGHYLIGINVSAYGTQCAGQSAEQTYVLQVLP